MDVTTHMYRLLCVVQVYHIQIVLYRSSCTGSLLWTLRQTQGQQNTIAYIKAAVLENEDGIVDNRATTNGKLRKILCYEDLSQSDRGVRLRFRLRLRLRFRLGFRLGIMLG